MGSIRNIIIGILVFTLIVTGLNAFYSGPDGLASQYGESEITISNQFDRTNRNSSINDLALNISRSLKDIETQEGQDDDRFIKSGYNVLRTVWKSTTQVTSLIGAVGKELNIPNLFIVFAGSIFTVFLAFAILSSIFRRET